MNIGKSQILTNIANRTIIMTDKTIPTRILLKMNMLSIKIAINTDKTQEDVIIVLNLEDKTEPIGNNNDKEVKPKDLKTEKKISRKYMQ